MLRGRDSGITASYLECFNCQEYMEHPQRPRYAVSEWIHYNNI